MRREKFEKMLTRSVRYAPALGARYGAQTAQRIGCEVEAMLSEEREVTPAGLLERASDPDNPLHPLFTWDERQAAEKYRLQEARHILNHLEIVVIRGEEVFREKALYSLPVILLEEAEEEAARRRYVPLAEMKGNAELEALLKASAIKELESFWLRYEHFGWEELAPLGALLHARRAMAK